MRLAVLTTTISRNAGGLFESVRYLHQHIACEVSTQVMSLRDAYTSDDQLVWDPLQIKIFDHIGPRSLGYSPSLGRHLTDYAPDLVHVHGIWQGPTIASNYYVQKSGQPHVISPRGMLDPWALKNSRWKKKIVGHLFEHRHLRSAACINALCESEADSIRKFGLKNPICVIPNAVNLPEKIDTRPKTISTNGVLLFLGRIHPKKGLVNAIHAWASLSKFCEWKFVIAGWDQGGHRDELEKLCRELGISVASVSAGHYLNEELAHGETDIQASVVFVGSVFGELKDKLLRSASAFILPSFSEGLPMSVLEAWSYRLPVLMTDHCNLPEGFAADAALRIGTDIESIAEGIASLLSAPCSSLTGMGDSGRALVERQFCWPQVAAQMMEVYEWVLEGGDAPDCVRQL